MEAMPEQTDSVPAEFTGNTRYLVSGTPEAGPWTGYYANYRGVKIAVSNIYGVWFEIRRRGTGFEAHRRARRELGLTDDPLTGIDYDRLHTTEEPLTRPSSRASLTAAATTRR